MRLGRGATAALWAILSIALVSSGTMWGQAVNATLLGTVTDSTGAVVPDAKVTVTEMKTDVGRTVTTNQSGNYELPDLPPGQYKVMVEQTGFKTETRANIDVVVNTTVRVNMTLQTGSASETVEVTGSAPILQTDRADVSTKIETKQVEDIPLGTNRNFQGLLNLVPGTTRAHREHSQFFNAQDSLSTEVNGASRLQNNLQLEGVDDNERTGLLQVLIPPIEAIQTVDVTTSNYAAEFGRAGGAVTNVVLKSGTNSFHGAAYEFNRISALSAKNYFNSGANALPVPRSVYNYYGANLGGPIYKDKTFFFMDFLLINDHQGQFNTSTVPTADFRSGDFSAMLNYNGKSYKIYDPATGNPDGTGRQQFSCGGRLNVICPNRFSPIALKLLALVPLPTASGYTSNFNENTHLNKDSHSYDVKVDHNISEKDRLSGRFSSSVINILQQPEFGLAGGPANGAFQGTGVQNSYDAAGYYMHLFSTSLLSELRVGVNHYRNTTVTSDHGTAASTALGIPGANLDPFTSGLTSIDIGSYSSPLLGYSASMPWVRGETNIDVVNNWTKIGGNHTFKWGADVRRVRDDLVQGQVFSPRGVWRYREGTTALNLGGSKSSTTNFANDFASFLLDIPNQVGRDVNVGDASFRQTQVFAYGQDQWKVSSKMTLDVGLRWELYPPATPNRAAGFSNFDPSTNNLVVAGVGGNPKNMGMDTHYTDFAPRVGIAYRTTDLTVLRAAFGVSYTPFQDNAYAFNYPVRQNNAYNSLSSFVQALYPNGQPANLPSGFPAPIVATIPSNGLLPADPASNYFVVDKHYRDPYLEFWNASVQQALPKNFVMNLSYVGNVGRNIPAQYNLNAGLVPGAGSKGRPEYPRISDTTLLFKRVTSNYNALQAKFDRRFSGGFLLTTSYTYAKAMGYKTDGGGTGGIDNYLDFRRNYNPVTYDRTHTFVQSYIYDLPFGHGKRWLQSGPGNWVLGGWQVSGVLTLMSGTPLVWSTSGGSLNAPGTSQTPNQTGPFRLLHGIGQGNPWFDTSAFAVPFGPVMGNMSRISYRGPGFFNLDASLFRRFAMTERANLELRAEAFSVTNTPQFSNPNTSVGSSNFGLITGGGGSRSMQLGAKIIF